jgi:hypothetical protein
MSLIATATTEWIGACAAVAAVLGAAVAIFQTRRATRQNNTYKYVDHFETPETRDLMAKSTAFFSCRERPPGISPAAWRALDSAERERRQWTRWEQLLRSERTADRRKVLELLAFPNQLESVAGMYNHHLLDRKVVKTHLAPMMETFWTRSAWWFDHVRSDPNTNTYQDLSKMLPDIRRRRRPRWHRPRDGRIKGGYLW